MNTRIRPQKRWILLALSCFGILLASCAEDPLAPPDLVEGRFIAGDISKTQKTLPQRILPVDWSVQDPGALNFDEAPTLSPSGYLVLGFSQVLQGSSIETINGDPNKITGFTAIPGVIEITQNNISLPASAYAITYRPDGGYIAPPDTSFSDQPLPAIDIQFTTPLTAGANITIYVIAGTVANTDGAPMQAQQKDGAQVKSPSGKPVAGAILFRVSQ
ncbi:MAG: hypothetical protein V4534_06265 [Myxococcota bacterium]